jgi:hypothetical protein
LNSQSSATGRTSNPWKTRPFEPDRTVSRVSEGVR